MYFTRGVKRPNTHCLIKPITHRPDEFNRAIFMLLNIDTIQIGQSFRVFISVLFQDQESLCAEATVRKLSAAIIDT